MQLTSADPISMEKQSGAELVCPSIQKSFVKYLARSCPSYGGSCLIRIFGRSNAGFNAYCTRWTGRGQDMALREEGWDLRRDLSHLGDNEFLLNELYEGYDDASIEGFYTAQLEPFVLDGRIWTLTPQMSQRRFAS